MDSKNITKESNMNEVVSVKKIKLLSRRTDEMELKNAANNNDYRKLKEIIDMVEDIDMEFEYNGFANSGTVLTFCCKFGRKEIVKYFIQLGCDVNKTDSDQSSPLMRATQNIECNENLEIIQLLIDSGADINFVNKYNLSALSFVTMFLNLEAVELLIFNGINGFLCGGMSLISVSIHENINMVQRLIEQGVSVNYINSYNGWTPLHYACENNNKKIVELLLNYGADENIKSKKGKKAIDLAKNEEIIELIKN